MNEIDEEEPIDKESFKITLEYTLEEFTKVKQELSKIASTPEQAIWKLLNL